MNPFTIDLDDEIGLTLSDRRWTIKNDERRGHLHNAVRNAGHDQ